MISLYSWVPVALLLNWASLIRSLLQDRQTAKHEWRALFMHS